MVTPAATNEKIAPRISPVDSVEQYQQLRIGHQNSL
jgi:hypothetical protein